MTLWIRLRRCAQFRNVAGSNLTARLAGHWDPTLLQGSRHLWV